MRYLLIFLIIPINSYCQQEFLNQDIEDLVLSKSWNNAYEQLNQALPNDKLNPNLTLLNGHVCLKLNKNDESFSSFLQSRNDDDVLENWLNYTLDLTNRYPNNETSYYLLGDAYARLKQYDKAIEQFDNSLKINSNFDLSILGKAVSKEKKGDLNSSFVELHKLTTLAPQFTDAKLSLANIYLKWENMPEALAIYNEIILQSDQPVALAHLGKALIIKNKNKPEAEKEFLQALSLIPQLKMFYGEKMGSNGNDNSIVANDDVILVNTTMNSQIVNIHITDFGINQKNDNQALVDNFSNVNNSVFPELNNQSKIVISMPKGHNFNSMSQSEKTDWTNKITTQLIDKVSTSIRNGNNDFEIQIVQDIGTLSYANPLAQKEVKNFGSIAYDAIGRLNEHLTLNNQNTVIDFNLGSNGTKVWAESTDHWKAYGANSKVNLHNGRAFENDVKKAISITGAENVTLIVNKHDLPTLTKFNPLNPNPIDYDNAMIANKDVAIRVANQTGAKVLYLEQKYRDNTTPNELHNFNYETDVHLSGMRQGMQTYYGEIVHREFEARTYTKSEGYSKYFIATPTTIKERLTPSQTNAYYNEWNQSRQYHDQSWSDWTSSQFSNPTVTSNPSNSNKELKHMKINPMDFKDYTSTTSNGGPADINIPSPKPKVSNNREIYKPNNETIPNGFFSPPPPPPPPPSPPANSNRELKHMKINPMDFKDYTKPSHQPINDVRGVWTKPSIDWLDSDQSKIEMEFGLLYQ